MEEDIAAIESQLIDICYHMQGGVQWETAWMLSHSERERMIRSINKKITQMNGGKEYM